MDLLIFFFGWIGWIALDKKLDNIQYKVDWMIEHGKWEG